MPIPPEAPSPPGTSLHNQLSHVTEVLAGARTTTAVLHAVLNPALKALSAVAGTVLLVDADGTRLEVASAQGDAQHASVWQATDLNRPTPATDALRQREALYYGQGGALTRDYPELEAMTGGLAAVATAVVPMHLEGRPVGVIVLDFREPHEFTPEERQFLHVLGAQCALALDRADLIRALHERVDTKTAQLAVQMRALDAYVAFTEAAGTETGVLALARQAMHLLTLRFPGSSNGYYGLDAGQWTLEVPSDDLRRSPDLPSTLTGGLPLDTPIFAAALTTRDVVFVDAWQAEREQLDGTEAYGAVAVYPLVYGGDVHAVYWLGLTNTTAWTPPDQATFRAVGRSLTLALERAAVAGELHRQRDEVNSRNRVLEAFAQLTRDLSQETDPHTLIRRAQEIIMSLLPPGYAAYWERRGDRWYVAVQVNDVGNPDLQRVIDGGLPVGMTPTLDAPFTSREPLFESTYVHGTDTAADLVSHIHAVGCVPVIVNGVVTGIVNVPLFSKRSWDTVDRGMLTTAVRSLGLALERAQSLTDLARRSAELERSNSDLQASNLELESFSYSVSHDLRAPLRHIVGFSDLALNAATHGQPDKLQRALGIIRDAAARMNGLIDAMLDHSRRARQELEAQPVDLDALVRRVIGDLQPDVAGRDVTWQVAPLPVVTGDEDLLRQVMFNLCSNAVKFTRGATPAVIEIWAEERDQQWAVSVRDNGAGFDQAYASKLFTVFQRLHPEREFEGSGVGLATVRRILQRHGGDITAEGSVGHGATFQFTLPRTAPPGR